VMGLATMLAFVVLGFTFLLLVPLALTMALVTAIVIWLER
jgi:hypothetical protein